MPTFNQLVRKGRETQEKKSTSPALQRGINSLKKKATVISAALVDQSGIVNLSRYRTRTLPSAGAILKDEDAIEKQTQFDV